MNKLETILNGIDKLKMFIKEKIADKVIFADILRVSPNETEILDLARKIGQSLAKAEKCLILMQERARTFQTSKAVEIMQEKGITRDHKIMTRVKNSLNRDILKSRDMTKDISVKENLDGNRIVNLSKRVNGESTRRTREQIALVWHEKCKVNKINTNRHWTREDLAFACGLSKAEVDNMGKAERETIHKVIEGFK